MILSRYNLNKIDIEGLSLPGTDIFELPEKVLQFGTGVLMRGLPDYLIDKANREGLFNGRIVVVKSTNVGSTTDFERQDGLYTLHTKGLDEGKIIDEQVVCSSISRVLSAANDWKSILNTAHNPHLKIIISNTTEVGIQLIRDNIAQHPPVSFPGKLLAVLYERYKAFNGSDKSGFIIIPTELIANNGDKLESIVLELAHLNKLEPAFMDWLENCNHFCNSLVDRIVPGKPDKLLTAEFEKTSGYKDNLRTVAEVYCLWAIEGNEEVRSALSFASAHKGIVITPNIEKYRELKLRLLNGTHTLSCGIAFLAGFKTVYEAMENPVFARFASRLMINEIVPVIPYNVDEHTSTQFAYKVIDRFKNPNIAHQWISISMQYATKLKLRVLPLLLNHYKHNNDTPECFAFGIAAFIRFMKVTLGADGKYTGKINGNSYVLTDNHAEKFQAAWENTDIKTVVETILKDLSLWDTNLNKLPGFKDAVVDNLEAIINNDTLQLLEQFELKAVAK